MLIKKMLVVVFAFVLLVSFSTSIMAIDYSPEVTEWLQENQFGPYQEEDIDYDELYEKAKEEGKVVVYASSSRGPAALEAGNWEEKYPEVEVEWNTLGTQGTVERLIREQEAGIYNVDVLNMSDYPTQLNVLAQAEMIFSWTPPELRDVIDEQWQHPISAHRFAARVLAYNTEVHDSPPIDNLWELTEPEWEGNIILVDPRTEASVTDQMMTLVSNADEMAEAYENYYGEEIELSTPNASYEWIRGVINNNPHVVPKSSDAYPLVGEQGQENPPIAIGVAMTHVRNAQDPAAGNPQFAPVTGVEPGSGAMVYPTLMNVAYNAPNPNAAKLLMHFLYGDEEGGEGYTPWFVPGEWPARQDVTETPEHPHDPELQYNLQDLNYWFMDAAEAWQIESEVFEFLTDEM